VPVPAPGDSAAPSPCSAAGVPSPLGSSCGMDWLIGWVACHASCAGGCGGDGAASRLGNGSSGDAKEVPQWVHVECGAASAVEPGLVVVIVRARGALGGGIGSSVSRSRSRTRSVHELLGVRSGPDYANTKMSGYSYSCGPV